MLVLVPLVLVLQPPVLWLPALSGNGRGRGRVSGPATLPLAMRWLMVSSSGAWVSRGDWCLCLHSDDAASSN